MEEHLNHGSGIYFAEGKECKLCLEHLETCPQCKRTSEKITEMIKRSTIVGDFENLINNVSVVMWVVQGEFLERDYIPEFLMGVDVSTAKEFSKELDHGLLEIRFQKNS